MSTKIDQKAYLQKYLSGPSKDKKKKKKKEKKVIKGNGFKIIDDDLDISKLRALETDELDILGEGEDAPQVAGIIDDRPEELKKMELFQTSTKWRVINQDDGFNSKIQIEEIKQSVKEVEKDNEIIFGKMYSDSEDERESKKQKDDSDASPPRKGSARKQNSDSDASPPRKSKNRNDSSSKLKQNYDSDTSPPRKSRKQNNDSDSNMPKKHYSNKQNDDRRTRKESKYDSDQSPPRKQSSKQSDDKLRKESRKQHSSNASPPRKRDKSPKKENNESRKRDKTKKPSRWGDFEFEKNEIEMISKEYEKRSKTDQRSDSPKIHNGSDVSRKRDKDRNTMSERERSKKGRHRSQRKQDSDSDLSPPRREKSNIGRDAQKRKNSSDSDLSPPRKNTGRETNRNIRSSDSPPPTNKKMAKTLEGKMAGLQDAKQLRQENESYRRKEDEIFNKMGDEISGRNAHAVSRKGKRETSEERNKKKEKSERQKEMDDKYKKWSKGLKQIEDQQERMQDFMHEASKPLARHKGDKDLEDRLKEVERAGDPMLQYIKEKKREAGELPPERPSYKGNCPPNRFNIRPGYRWDGVDRSNGYEKKYFDQQSKRKAQEEEAYKWSTEDL